MPTADPPQVSQSFANAFWGVPSSPGMDPPGVEPLMSRMIHASTTMSELKAFYKARADLEEEYSKKLLAISRKALGSVELGTLRASLDVARGETEVMGKQHGMIAQQMRSDCEEPLAAFGGGIKERRKIIQNTIERLLKTKQTQTTHVLKCRDKYEQDCLRIKGYLAQGHMVMGQEERKNKAKLEKTQINMANNSTEYETAVKVLEDTTGRWNKEWKAACDKFQDLEEERLDFMKSSLWQFANIASTVCVSDDASCEKVRLALENCEVEKDIANFIKVMGTGQEIPDPPRYINFAKVDSDTLSEASEDDAYSVAQFSRTTNPAFRSASPSHDINDHSMHREQSEDIEDLPVEAPPQPVQDMNSGRPQPLVYRAPEPNVPPNYSPSQHGHIPSQVPHNEYPTDGMTMYCRRDEQGSRAARSDLSANTRPSSRDDQSDYSNPSSFTSAEPMSGAVSPTKPGPVNGVAMPGMAPTSSASPEKELTKRRSGFFSKSPFNSNSPFRRKSKKEPESSRPTWNINMSRSDLSTNSNQSSPTKRIEARQPETPFNRHAGVSAPEGEEAADPRANFQLNIGPNVLDVASPDDAPSGSHQSTPRASIANARRGNFAPAMIAAGADDPVAQALANLKQSSGGLDMSKRASLRQPVDSYHRVKTPAPDTQPQTRPSAISKPNQDVLAAQRGTPPPAYEGSRGHVRAKTALGVPQPAFTSKEMRTRTETWGMGSSVSAPVNPQSRPGSSMGRPSSRDGRRSPGPGMTGMVPRSASPQPQMQSRQQELVRARSPGPQMQQQQHQPSYTRSRSPAPPMQPQQQQPAYSRSRSPAPPMNTAPPQQRPPQAGSASSRHSMMNNSAGGARPTSSYGSYDHAPNSYDQRGRGADPSVRRERSKSIAAPGMPSGRQPSADQRQQQQAAYHPRAISPNPYAAAPAGRPRAGTSSSPRGPPIGGMEIQLAPASDVAPYGGPPPAVCFMARAMYSYAAAIPEELSFSKGDILAVLRLQDDGWWEAEVNRSVKTGGPHGGVGLVPSNYLQRC